MVDRCRLSAKDGHSADLRGVSEADIPKLFPEYSLEVAFSDYDHLGFGFRDGLSWALGLLGCLILPVTDLTTRRKDWLPTSPRIRTSGLAYGFHTGSLASPLQP